MANSIDEVYERFLDDDEHILWSKEPDRRRLHLDGGCISAVMIIAFSGYGIFSLITAHNTAADWVMGGLFVLIGLMFLLVSVKRTAAYYVTDKRVLILGSLSVKELKYYDIAYVNVEKQKKGSLGNVVMLKSKLVRKGHSRTRNSTVYTGYTLFDLEDAERVKELILQQKDMPRAYAKAEEIEQYQR